MINPTGMDVTEWTDRMALLVGDFTIVQRLDDPENWREWAVNLLDNPNVQGQNTPDPYQFDHWEEWATRFNQFVDLPG